MAKRSKRYIDIQLEPTYRHTRDHFYQHIMEINLAHVLMLRDQAILDSDDAREILDATYKLYKQSYTKEYDDRYEDLFFMLEADLTEIIGPMLVGNMHIAFSRNDMDTTMFRMFWREKITTWLDKVNALRRTILALVKEHKHTIMTAHTHNQQAQPTTLAHYLLAVENNLQRDTKRGLELYKRINVSPMGAAALSTTGFNIDRHHIGTQLGFDSPMANSYDAISASDFMMEISSVLSISLSSISRFVYDLIFMTTNEVNTLRLHDQHVQTSSIMPQKRNPSALEHTRASISKAMGELQGTMFLTHNVPLGDIVDIGDDIQMPLYSGYSQTINILDILTEILEHGTFHKERLLYHAQNGFSTVTELADVLVRNYEVPFRISHGIVSKFVKELLAEGNDLTNGSANKVNKIAQHEFQLLLNVSEEDYRKAVCPKNFINVRDILGGPAATEVENQYVTCLETLTYDESWVKATFEKLDNYILRLHETVEMSIKR
ncbi:argininosuccinate lyase [Bacillus alkalisoli]|uniref:argininosuccinate lyase n=1 Tax=Bacillus alkalisoli TaxID=2011008 RepID=UPI000C23729A|nr:argininosuccinate lyase [Bacillus alkalisoli]